MNKYIINIYNKYTVCNIVLTHVCIFLTTLSPDTRTPRARRLMAIVVSDIQGRSLIQ